jgi:hypothetical protein
MCIRKWDVVCQLKLIFAFTLDLFQGNLGEVSDEQGEHFHQDFNSTEHRCPGFWKDFILADIVP